MRPDRSVIRGSTIFCDDIRNEVGGKVSYMGVYNGSLLIGDPLPIVLAKFCMAVNVRWYRDEPLPAEPLKLRVFGPDGNALVEGDLQFPSDADAGFSATEATEDAYMSAMLNVVLSPFEVKQEGFIKVRLYAGEHEMKLGALQIAVALPVE